MHWQRWRREELRKTRKQVKGQGKGRMEKGESGGQRENKEEVIPVSRIYFDPWYTHITYL